MKKQILDIIRRVVGTKQIDEKMYSIEQKINLIEQISSTFEEKLDRISDKISSAEHKIFIETRDAIENVHFHLDFVQRDMLMALDQHSHFIDNDGISIITDYPVAFTSPDHIVPVGTVNDYTRHPRFVRACESIFPNKNKLSFLDCGCSSGGIILDAILRGHIGIGLEGSDISLLQQRAEWRLLKHNLFTCDLSKPFVLTNTDDKETYKFDVISAWEFLEHLDIDGLSNFFAMVRKHMHNESIFAASVALYDHCVDSVHLHQTVKPQEWWYNFFEENGFELCEHTLRYEDFARGNGNSPVFYKRHDYFHEDCILIVLKKSRNEIKKITATYNNI